MDRSAGRRSREAEALEALGYLSEGDDAPEGDVGVVLHDARAVDGTNLLVSAHDFELVLFDMDGATLHTWTLPERERKRIIPSATGFRKAYLRGDSGEVAAIVEGQGLWVLDRNSRVLWRADDANHHDMVILDDGGIISLGREAGTHRWFPNKGLVLDDRLVRYAPDGTKLGETSILKGLMNSDYAHLVPEAVMRGRDPLHTNSVWLLTGATERLDPAFEAGRILLSMRALSMIAVFDPESRSIVWAKRGFFRKQHDARELEDGRIMLLDNHTPHGPSGVRVYDPRDMSLAWAYQPGGRDAIYSATCSTAMPLEGGHVHIVYSRAGVVLEVTPEGEVVWRFHTPHRIGTVVANMFDVVRYPPAAQLGWLQDTE